MTMTSIVVHEWPDHSKSLGSGPGYLFIIASSKASLWLALILPFNLVFLLLQESSETALQSTNQMNFEGMYIPIIAGQIRLPYPEEASIADMVNHTIRAL